ncbi:hypothetical protein L1987_54119 [Smallanthus sonchifolius]|uniref:Uncharacterized protein n=1 Tax=Smallanthus sonchifolius TaxID=185202 RepID=A0ACB9E688_9ASTR|nr:hypothetical protein L1987_54119 [Smallanthus sonchifolius]
MITPIPIVAAIFVPYAQETDWNQEDYRIKFLNFSDELIYTHYIIGSSDVSDHAPTPYEITDDVVKIYGGFVINRRLRFRQTGDLIHIESRVNTTTKFKPGETSSVAGNFSKSVINVDKEELIDAHYKAMSTVVDPSLSMIQ